MKNKLRITALTAALIIIMNVFSVSAAQYEDVKSAADSADEWRVSETGSDEALSSRAGENVCDWLAFGYARRIGGVSQYPAAALKYFESEKDSLTLPDCERLAIVSAAYGADISQNGMLDAVFADIKKDELHDKLVNQLIFALLALDSGRCPLPEGSDVSRSDLVDEILSRQTESGALYLVNTNTHETDVTAMALTALAPYRFGSEKCRIACEKMLGYLASQTESDGTVRNWGKPSCETTAQVITALSTLGIDVSDPRFSSGGKTVLDGLLAYRLDDGGFSHNGESLGSDAYATAQAYYSMTAYLRLQGGERALYDIRPEMTEREREKIDSVKSEIAALDTSDEAECERVCAMYCEVAVGDRMYVYNADILLSALIDNGIEHKADYSPDDIAQKGGGSLTAYDDSVSVLEQSKPVSQPSGKRGGSAAEAVLLIVIGVFAAAVIVWNHAVRMKKLNERK